MVKKIESFCVGFVEQRTMTSTPTSTHTISIVYLVTILRRSPSNGFESRLERIYTNLDDICPYLNSYIQSQVDFGIEENELDCPYPTPQELSTDALRAHLQNSGVFSTPFWPSSENYSKKCLIEFYVTKVRLFERKCADQKN